MQTWRKEIAEHLETRLIPFWESLKDEVQGGYYGYMGYDLAVDKGYEKGCILNSRILWFFSSAYKLLGEPGLFKDAAHAYDFLRKHCLDQEYGGIYWSVTCDGQRKDDSKHTYNQAFAVYALSAYYDASGDREALELALKLYELIEERCRDAGGYGEAYGRDFRPVSNEKLSENGVLAERTMNTLLHLLEAYTELYRVSGREEVAERLRFMLELLDTRVYNQELGRQEVFFDREWNTLLDLHSYGHDIETSWLVDRCLEVLRDEACTSRIRPITEALARNIYERAFSGSSLPNEAERGVVDSTRVWWVQAEAVVGFVNAWEKQGREEYLQAACRIWRYIQETMTDKRKGSEWYWAVDEAGRPLPRPIVEPWKCPYHNGRMCIEVIRRLGNDT